MYPWIVNDYGLSRDEIDRRHQGSPRLPFTRLVGNAWGGAVVRGRALRAQMAPLPGFEGEIEAAREQEASQEADRRAARRERSREYSRQYRAKRRAQRLRRIREGG